MWHTNAGGGGDNRTGFGSAETDQLIDDILVTLDEEKRNQMYKQMQRVIYDEQPVIFLFILKSKKKSPRSSDISGKAKMWLWSPMQELQELLNQEANKLAELRSQCQGGNCQGGQCLAPGQCDGNKPGKGGITRGRGEFIFPGQIEASPARYIQALFWGLKTVRVHQTRPPTLLPRDPTGPRPAQDPWAVDRVGPWNDVLVIPNRVGSGYCSPSIYVDGIWLRELNAGESLADAVPKDELLAVEVYEWPFGVPQQYTGNQECGVILFWTRMQ